MSFSFGVVNLFEFICLVSLGGALSVCRAWQRFSEHDWWVRANSVFLVLRTFPSVCGIQVLPGGEGKIPFLPACVARLLHQYACLQLSHFLLPFLSTSVFILIKQMKTLIEAGNGGGLRWRGMLQEMYVTHWGCKSAWMLLRLYNNPFCLLWLGRIRWWWVVTHLGRGAELEETDGNFSLYYSRRVKIYRLCVLAVGQEPPKKVLKMWPLFSRMSI